MGEDEEWRDNREFPHVVPVDNGLLDPVTGDLYQHNPTFFSTRKIHATWNPDLLDDDEFYTAFRNSPCGDFLDEIFADKPEADDGPTQKDLLQEMFGYLLFGDNRLQKGFVIIGPQRSGKGTINKLLSHLLGSTACAPKTRSLASQFGAQGLLDKRLATVTDARIDPKTNFGDLAELLLSITGDDPQDVERKFLTTITVKMMVRFLLLSNALPHLRDPQGVLADRFVYLETAVSFLGKENLSLFDELVAHNSLWLAWALRGYQTLHNKGAKAKFSSTSTHERLSDEAKAEMAPIKTFADRFLVRDTNGVIDTDHIHLAFLDWAETIGIASWPKNKLNARLRKDFRGLRIAQKVVPVITTPFDNDPYFSTVETVKRRCFVGFRWAEGKEPTAAQIVEWKENNSDELN
ncbi:DUF5906 domain-containing protein [Shimia thalassica]|uniref:DUF5906 domain-containing protein n=1 Tax=Shimia thalassica TaxID=1715693 RepID=UPI0026E198A3|nr:DUF5906 domain-containing protein [Shimia thalassica]MDO6479128.1 DUF5906 domain-containing protein [Shimia thalassica]